MITLLWMRTVMTHITCIALLPQKWNFITETSLYFFRLLVTEFSSRQKTENENFFTTVSSCPQMSTSGTSSGSLTENCGSIAWNSGCQSMWYSRMDRLFSSYWWAILGKSPFYCSISIAFSSIFCTQTLALTSNFKYLSTNLLSRFHILLGLMRITVIGLSPFLIAKPKVFEIPVNSGHTKLWYFQSFFEIF